MGRPIDILYIWHIYFSASVNVPRKMPFPRYNYEIYLILRAFFATTCVNRPYFNTPKPRNSRLIIIKRLLIFRFFIITLLQQRFFNLFCSFWCVNIGHIIDFSRHKAVSCFNWTSSGISPRWNSSYRPYTPRFYDADFVVCTTYYPG